MQWRRCCKLPAARADEISQILRGYEIISEIFPKGTKLNLAGKDLALVGLGSYLVNSTGCNDCHTHPNWAMNGNPYLGQPEQINTAEYLAGGRQFGPDPVDGHIVYLCEHHPRQEEERHAGGTDLGRISRSHADRP